MLFFVGWNDKKSFFNDSILEGPVVYYLVLNNSIFLLIHHQNLNKKTISWNYIFYRNQKQQKLSKFQI